MKYTHMHGKVEIFISMNALNIRKSRINNSVLSHFFLPYSWWGREGKNWEKTKKMRYANFILKKIISNQILSLFIAINRSYLNKTEELLWHIIGASDVKLLECKDILEIINLTFYVSVCRQADTWHITPDTWQTQTHKF